MSGATRCTCQRNAAQSTTCSERTKAPRPSHGGSGRFVVSGDAVRAGPPASPGGLQPHRAGGDGARGHAAAGPGDVEHSAGTSLRVFVRLAAVTDGVEHREVADAEDPLDGRGVHGSGFRVRDAPAARPGLRGVGCGCDGLSELRLHESGRLEGAVPARGRRRYRDAHSGQAALAPVREQVAQLVGRAVLERDQRVGDVVVRRGS